MASATPGAPPHVQLVTRGPEDRVVCISGQLSLSEAARLWEELEGCVRGRRGVGTFHLDLSRVESLDGSTAAILAHFRSLLRKAGFHSEFLGVEAGCEPLLNMYGEDFFVCPVRPSRAPAFLEQVGNATAVWWDETKRALGFLGQVLSEMRVMWRTPRSANWADLPPTMERTGADALPIVLLINFLVGLVMAFQASVQLKRFGANLLVADLIGISMTRELGPLMTAIVVCGRSGAAFAAELGTMQVNEETDALRVMGLSPVRYLVFPRVVGLFLVVPLLAFMADVVGVLGGLTVALTRLDLTFVAYVQQTSKAVELWDIYSGGIKAAVFGLCIGVIACQQGLASEGGAAGVGRRTTTAVVLGLFTLILVDAMFTVGFRLVGL